MGLYLQIDDSEPESLASNVGWGDVCRWAKALPSGEADCVQHLCTYGWEQDAAQLSEQLEATVKAYPPKHDTMATLHNLSDMLGSAKKAKLIIVTDGMSKGPGGSAQEKRAALLLWERKALRRLKERKTASAPFQSDAIEPEITRLITAELAEAQSPEDVRAVFAAVMQ